MQYQTIDTTASTLATQGQLEPWTLEPRTEAHHLNKLVQGVGVNDAQNASVRVDGKLHLHPAYNTWRGLLQRTYCPKLKARKPQRYADVAPEWISLMGFYNWWCEQPSYPRGNLDSDLLAAAGNLPKGYGPETTASVPHQINTLLGDCKGSRGYYPQGINWDKANQKYQVKILQEGKQVHLGRYACPAEATAVYWEAKLSYAPTRAAELLTDHPLKQELLEGVCIILEQQHADALEHLNELTGAVA